MLYKKIHRQYLRQWRLGRKFKYGGFKTIFKITNKPYIDKNHTIRIDEKFPLISITGPFSGSMLSRDWITWLD